MGSRRTRPGRSSRCSVFFLVCWCALALPVATAAKTGIVNTKHNLSDSGPGPFKSDTEKRICVFCHTPHNARPATPLWNKDVDPINYDPMYTPYDSTTMAAGVMPPTGPSRLCLSCHDGTIALGAVRNPAAGIEMPSGYRQISGGGSYLSTDLRDDHPVSFPYNTSASQKPQGLVPPPPAGLLLYGAGNTMHCSTCHDPHDNTNRKFLAVDSRSSALCLRCHVIENWSLSTHKSSVSLLAAPWPGMEDWGGIWTTMADYGCENCHTAHAAGSTQRLLRSNREEDVCLSCHRSGGNVPAKDIEAQISKFYRHPVRATEFGVTTFFHDPAAEENAVYAAGHVECIDCHNPHAVNDGAAVPPLASGRLRNVRGVQRDGLTPVYPAQFEYEICFRCHAGPSAPQTFTGYTPRERVVQTIDVSRDFRTTNPSFHPVEDMRNSPNVPSIPSSERPELNAQSKIYCSECHGDDGPTAGPHGSDYAPLLKKQYEMAIGTQESAQNYALCYRCHNRSVILSDASFQKNTLSGKGGHSGHLAPSEPGWAGKGIPCSLCHDPHGVENDGGLSGSHTYLINFDRTGSIVTGTAGNTYPLFTDNGNHTGTCTLRCHLPDNTVMDHVNASYP